MAPSLEMRIKTTIGTSLELVQSLDDVADIIYDLRNANINVEKDLLRFLNDSYEVIDCGEKSGHEMRMYYLASLAILAFGEPILETEIPEKMRKGFERLFRKVSGFESPLELYFKKADEKPVESVEDIEDLNLEVVARVPMNLRMGTSRAVGEIISETRELYGRMKKRRADYDRGDHLTFSGLLNVALPLVGGYKSRNQFSDLYNLLRETRGEFVFKIPEFD